MVGAVNVTKLDQGQKGWLRACEHCQAKNHGDQPVTIYYIKVAWHHFFLCAEHCQELSRLLQVEESAICEHCAKPIDREESQDCATCGWPFHPECLDDHAEECRADISANLPP
jgi:hypothetical protein